LEMSKRNIKSLAKIDQLFEESKSNQESREAIFLFCKIHFFQYFSKRLLILES